MTQQAIVLCLGPGVLKSPERFRNAARLLTDPRYRVVVVETADLAILLNHVLLEVPEVADDPWRTATLEERALCADVRGINLPVSYDRCAALFSGKERIIVPGDSVYALSCRIPAVTTTAATSGAVIAASIGALYQALTDSERITKAPSDIVTSPPIAERMSMIEAREASILGAFPLNPQALVPICEHQVYTSIGVFDDPSGPHTTLTALPDPTDPIACIAYRSGLSMISIGKLGMHEKTGALLPLLRALSEAHVPFDYLATGHDIVNVFFSEGIDVDDAASRIHAALDRTLQGIKVRVKSGFSVVMVVGERIRQSGRVAARIHEILELEASSFLPLGAVGSPGVMYAIPEGEVEQVVKTLYYDLCV